ncbi:Cytoplasmic and mitochondrial histidine tRNA synthetase [Gaertneriomyces sp. JEL0708]|nr:Cytoplasmic and mitochondrial histidine tRNA synthetase [Gaertneriomyces sp. JEL0708]
MTTSSSLLADLETQEASIRQRIKELKKNNQKDDEKLALEELKDVMRRKKELLPKKPKKGDDAAQTEPGLAETPVRIEAKQPAEVKEETVKTFTLKTPKGTKDYDEKDMAIREKIFSTITTIFKRHGAITIDTPVFELKEILSGKYGEDSKLIYDLEDQGGEKCSLRYDLTVPFARYLAENGISNLKRYHIAKVYRRDQPAMNRGRMREFYQCDFDIAGTYDPMVPDAEIMRVMFEILTALEIGKFTIKINHRKILDGMFEVCGVPEDKIRTISSAVDKLDKMPWADVKKEMVVEKGLAEDVADRIGTYVKLKGSKELCDKLAADAALAGNVNAKTGIEEMRILLGYLELFNMLDSVSFDLSLARGLDYYTGVIYEAVVEGSPSAVNGEPAGVGSVAAGGRYDELVGMFSGNKKIPCVGVSIGVERVFALLASRQDRASIKSKETEVYVIGLGSGFLEERMRICCELWDTGVKAEYMLKKKPRSLQQQFEVCDREQIPLAVIVGGKEIEAGVVKIRRMGRHSADDAAKEVEVPRMGLAQRIKELLATL